MYILSVNVIYCLITDKILHTIYILWKKENVSSVMFKNKFLQLNHDFGVKKFRFKTSSDYHF